MSTNPTIKVQMGASVVEKSPAEKVADFEALIERYKVQNPVKYEQKKDSLEKQLKDLKTHLKKGIANTEPELEPEPEPETEPEKKKTKKSK